MSLHSIEIKKKTISRYNECAKKCMFVKKLNEYSNEREKKTTEDVIHNNTKLMFGIYS